MTEYGFLINVKGNSITEMQKIQTELGKTGVKFAVVSTETKEATANFGRLGQQVESLGKIFAEVFAFREIFEFGKKLVETTAEFEGYSNRIKFASRDSFDARENTRFLNEEVSKLHIPLREAAEGFSEMQAGLVGTGIEGQRLRNLFDGISSAAATLHLSSYNLQRTLLDFKEIGEIGLNMRIYKSLGTALPGIGNVIREAFGKSYHELEQEGMSGPNFLAKLGPALAKHFSGGVENYVESMQAKIADVQTAVTQQMLAMGERLRPILLSIMTGIKDVFNSAPVRFFMDNISTLATVLLKVLTIFITYKTLMIGIMILQKGWALLVALNSGSFAALTTAITGATAATEGFQAAMLSTGVGVFAVALGLIIADFIQVNDQMDKAMDKVVNLGKLKDGLKNIDDEGKGLDREYANFGNLSGQEKGEYVAALQDFVTSSQTALDTKLVPLLNDAKANRARYHEKSDVTDAFDKNIKELTTKVASAQGEIKTFSARVQDLIVNKHIKPIQGGALLDTNTGKGLHGSHLSGAEGGLNQARIVNMRIDNVMKIENVYEGKDLHKHAETAVDFIIRSVNNLVESQSGTM